LKFLPSWTNGYFPDYPFLDRMTIAFFAIVLIMTTISLLKPKPTTDTHDIVVDTEDFKVSTGFIIGSFIICGMLLALYTIFW